MLPLHIKTQRKRVNNMESSFEHSGNNEGQKKLKIEGNVCIPLGE